MAVTVLHKLARGGVVEAGDGEAAQQVVDRHGAPQIRSQNVT